MMYDEVSCQLDIYIKNKTAEIGNSKNLKTVTPEASLLWAHIIFKGIVQELQQIQSAILTYSATFKTTT